MIQALDGKSGDRIKVLERNTQNQEVEEEKSILTRSDFPELEFVGIEEIAAANKIRKEIKFFKAAALRYLHEKKYLLIDTMEQIMNSGGGEEREELIQQIDENEIASRIFDLLHTKEFCIKDENGMRQIKLADIKNKMETLKTDFPEIVQDFSELDMKMDLNINIVKLMHIQEGNEVKFEDLLDMGIDLNINITKLLHEQERNRVELKELLSKSWHMDRFENFIVEFSTWLSKKLNIKSLNIEEKMAGNIVKLLRKKNKLEEELEEKLEIGLQKAIIAQRCIKVIENIRIDFEKSEYK